MLYFICTLCLLGLGMTTVHAELIQISDIVESETSQFEITLLLSDPSVITRFLYTILEARKKLTFYLL